MHLYWTYQHLHSQADKANNEYHYLLRKNCNKLSDRTGSREAIPRPVFVFGGRDCNKGTRVLSSFQKSQQLASREQ